MALNLFFDNASNVGQYHQHSGASRQRLEIPRCVVFSLFDTEGINVVATYLLLQANKCNRWEISIAKNNSTLMRRR